ncbi:hypothetical protein J3459_011393 [Metarhizium acridum]|nr:hypothetical protein J3459_011393 [Metarhizium acridum]
MASISNEQYDNTEPHLSETTPLLHASHDRDVESLRSSRNLNHHLALHSTYDGDDTPYKDYATIDWLMTWSKTTRGTAYETPTFDG